MLKLMAVAAFSALAGAALSSIFIPSLFADAQQARTVQVENSIDAAALTAQSKDLPVLVIEDPL